MYLQGVPGAYSEAAAAKAYPRCEAVPCEQFEAAFQVLLYYLESCQSRLVVVHYGPWMCCSCSIPGRASFPAHALSLLLPC